MSCLQAEQAHRLRDWTTGMVSYDSILSGLKEVSAAPRVAEAGYASADACGGAVHHSAGGGAPLHKRKRKSAAALKASSISATPVDSPGRRDDPLAKKRRTKPAPGHRCNISSSSSSGSQSSSSDSSDDDTSDDDSSDDDTSDRERDHGGGRGGGGSSSNPSSAAVAEAAAERAKSATHLARYKRRQAAKAVARYSAADLAAILGADAAPTAPPPAVGNSVATVVAAHPNSDGGTSRRDVNDRETRTSAPPPAERPGPCNEDVEDGCGRPGRATAEARWWSSLFIQAGRMGAGGGAAGSSRRINVSGFSEQDQTNLYVQVGTFPDGSAVDAATSRRGSQSAQGIHVTNMRGIDAGELLAQRTEERQCRWRAPPAGAVP